jgi:hypothetical protein
MKTMRIVVLFAFAMIAGLNAFSAEKMTLKSGDVYTCDFVLQNAEKVVVLLFGSRVEIPPDEVKQVSFESSEDELEIVLNDNTVLKGQIVEQDSEFYTVGTAAGLNTMEKAKIKEIRNPKYAQFYAAKKADAIGFHAGVFPSYTTVLNGFGTSYNTFWGGEIYAEFGLLRNFWLGLDADFLMLTPQFDSTNEILFMIPVNITFKYESSFGEPGDAKNPFSNLSWYLKAGAGVSVDLFMEQAEARTSTAVAMSMAVSYGLKYAVLDFLSIGLGGKTAAVFEPSTYVFTQSGGVILEFRL